MDTQSFVNPARVRSLIAPINRLKRADFNQYLDQLKKVEEVRLVDLTPENGILFNPQAFPQGRVFYNFLGFMDDSSSLLLHDFEPFRKTFSVIGITKWTKDLTEDQLLRHRQELQKKYSNVISHFIIVFDAPPVTTFDNENIFTVESSNSQSLETAICDLTSKFLVALSVYASSYNHIVPRSPASMISIVPSRTPTVKRDKPRKRLTGSFENTSEKVIRGRRSKLSGNFNLLAGNVKAALGDFCIASECLKAAQDNLWLASALEGMALCSLILTYLEIPFQLPAFINTLLENSSASVNVPVRDGTHSPFQIKSPSASPRPSLQASLNGPAASQLVSSQIPQFPIETIPDLITKLYEKALSSYISAMTEPDDRVPQPVFCDSSLRYIKFIVSVAMEGDEFNINTLSNIVYNLPPSSSSLFEITDNIDIAKITELASSLFNQHFKELSLLEKFNVYNEMINIYSKLKLNRKKSLLINELIELVLTSDILTPSKEYMCENLTKVLDEYCQNYGINTNDEEIFGKPTSIQKKVLVQVLKFSQRINHSLFTVKYGSILLRNYRPVLTDAELLDVYNVIKPIIAEQKPKHRPKFWDSALVQDLEIFTNMKDSLVQNDISDATVTLKNCFPFEIEIIDLELSTEDNFPIRTEISFKKASVDSSQSKTPVILKPKSTTRVPLFIVPSGKGTFKVDGIAATVSSTNRQVFRVDVRADNSISKLKSHSALECLKHDTVKKPTFKIVEMKVLNAQPFLKLLDVNLNNKWITLLEGECKRFNVLLKNTSDVEINNLVSRFNDSTIEPLNQLLTNRNLPPNEVYEIEYYLIKKKPFKILNKDALQNILGNSEFTLNMEIWGKRGVKEACLILEYSNSNTEGDDDNARTMVVPVNVTVYPSVELVGCEFIPLSSNTKLSADNNDSCWSYLKLMVKQGHKLSDFCLLALDFINSWSQEMEVSLQSLLTGSDDPEFQENNGPIENLPDDAFATTIYLQAKKNARVLVPIKRMSFDLDYLNERIPSLRNKQFIFDYKTPEGEKVFINHAFWYRDELMKRLRACWRIMEDSVEMNTKRTGTIDLRSIRFSSKMVEILEVEKIGINITLLDMEGNSVDQDSVQLGEFYSVHIKLTNRHKWGVFGMLRHIPVCRSSSGSLERKVLFNGVLQFGLGDEEVEAGKSVEFDLGVVFLEKGEYEWGALFDEMADVDGKITIKQQHLQREQLKLKVC